MPRPTPHVFVGHACRSFSQAYSAESFGDATFTAWMLLLLRTAEPESIRLSCWSVLEDLAHKLPVASPPRERIGAWAAPATPAKDGDRVLAALETSLCRGRLAQLAERAEARSKSFLYRLAVHHLATAAFGGSAPQLLSRLLAAVPARTCLELICDAGLAAHNSSLDADGGEVDHGVIPAHRLRLLGAVMADQPEIHEKLKQDAPTLALLVAAKTSA